MSFADAMREEGRFTRTENGAVALNTSGDARLDLFGTIGSLREADENRITTLFAEAYAQDKGCCADYWNRGIKLVYRQ